MPSRNILKQYSPHSYYHVYNRGVNKQKIFNNAADKAKLMSIFKRHLDRKDQSAGSDGFGYTKYDKNIDFLAYCLMGNHYHILLFVKDDPGALTKLMQSVFTAYTMYFNRKYKRTGTLFENVYKASRIDDESYLLHITRYVHMNPRYYKTYNYSSIKYYLKEDTSDWIKVNNILDMFEGDSYLKFLEDYEGQKEIWDDLKHQMADQ